VERPANRPGTIPGVGGYVLAGGKSSRMGRDKALLELGGKPLIAHAVTKLCRLCANVHILGANPALAVCAPLVFDLHPGCGPISGLEAALANSPHDWNLMLPVDMPFVPTAFLEEWVRRVAWRRSLRIRVAYFSVFGRPQPALLLVHRDAAPHLTQAIARGEYKLLPALEGAAAALALPGAKPPERVPYVLSIDEHLKFGGREIPPVNVRPWQLLTPGQRAAQPLWFANLNTPEDFRLAEANIAALDS